jgi:hypothetical protein
MSYDMCLEVVHGYKGRNVGLIYSSIARLEWVSLSLMRIKQNIQIVDMKKD